MRPRRIRRVVPRGYVRGRKPAVAAAAPVRRVPPRRVDVDQDQAARLDNSQLTAVDSADLPDEILLQADTPNLIAAYLAREPKDRQDGTPPTRKDGEPAPVDQVAKAAQTDGAAAAVATAKAPAPTKDAAVAKDQQQVQAPNKDADKQGQKEKDQQAKDARKTQRETRKKTADQKGGKDADLNKPAKPPKRKKPNPALARAQLAAWRSSAGQATAAIKKPGLGAAGGAPGKITAKGKAAVAAQKKTAAQIPKDARKAAKKPKPKDPLPPIKDNPVKGADDLVKPKLDLRLPDQTMPDLQKSPRGTLPKMGDRPQPEPKPAKPGKAPPVPKAPKKGADKKTVDKIKKAGEKKPKTDVKAKGNPLTLKDEPPPPAPPLHPRAKDAVGEVLARLLADPKGKAETMLKEARVAAYPGGVLQAKFKEIGKGELPGMTEALTTQLNMVAKEAGIADEKLKAKVKNYQDSLKKDKNTAQKSLVGNAKTQRESLKKVAQQQQDAIAGGRQALAVHNQNQVAAAGGKPDPKVINKQRRDLKGRISRVVGRSVGNYGQALKRRKGGLDRIGAIQKMAYRAAVQTDKKAIRKEKPQSGSNVKDIRKLGLELAKIDAWGAVRQRAVDRSAANFKLDAGEAAGANKKAVRDAGRQAYRLIDKWADDKLGIELSWWDKLWAWITDWFAEAEAEAEVWEQARASDTKNAILTDFGVLQQFQKKYGSDLKKVTDEQLKGLSEEQKAVIKAFYSKGGGNPITAVAAGLEKRLSLHFRPQLFKRFEKELPKVDASRWEDLELVAQTQGSFSAFKICKEMYAAMFGGITGWGTDEDRIFGALGGLTKLQGIVVRKCYQNQYGRNLDDDIKSELGGEDYRRAKSQLEGDKVTAAVTELYQAMHGGLTGWGTDEDAIMRVMRGKSVEEIEAIKRKYRQLYGESLDKAFKSEMSEHDLDRANALLDGDAAKADAIALDQAMRGGWTGWGTDEDAINKVYADIRKEVEAEAAAKGWNTKKMEAEIARRKLLVEHSYNRKYGGDWKDSNESALRQAFKSEMEGPQLDLANALADNDRMKADQARFAVEAKTSWLYVDKDVTNKVLENQYNRALEEVKRDSGWNETVRKLREQGRKKGLSPYEIDAQIRAERAKLENKAKQKASDYMKTFEQGYNKAYGGQGQNVRDVVGYEKKRKKDGAVDKKHIRNKASELLDSGGYLDPHLRAFYAMDGVGTNEEELKKSLKGKTAAEIAEIKKKYKEMTGRELQDDIDSDTSGRDNQQLKWDMRGIPENAKQEYQLAKDKMDWELKNQSGFLAGKEKEVLKNRMDAMKKEYDAVANMDPKLSPQEKARAWDKFRNRSGDVNTAIEGYVEQSNAVVDTLASAAAITATRVVIGVAAVRTGGAAAAGAPAVLAALGSALSSGTVAAASAAAAAAATIAVKASMKGDAYGWEDMAVDAAVGGVDAVVSFYTAGIGDKLLKAGRAGTLASKGMLGKGFQAIGGNRLGKMAIGPSRMGRMLAHGVAEGAEGLVSSFPSALTGNLLNDQNWEKGNPFLNITTGTLFETGMGTVISGGMGTLGGIAKYKPKKPPSRPTGDILAHQPSVKDRAAAWKAFKQENPGADFKTWKKQFDEGLSQKLAAGDAAKKQTRAMRKELMRDIPAAQRKQFADTPIEVLSDADFKALTKSDSGKAVVLFEKGKARIVVRQGMDIKKLREEGIHLLQSVEKETRKKVAKLDERVLRNWDRLSLDNKLDLYRTKIELEIDAHRRMINGIEDDLAAAGDDAAKKALRRQLDDAEHTLANLNKRMGEVKDIGPDDKALIRAGLKDEPDYLDQPARLFMKEKPAKPKQVKKATRKTPSKAKPPKKKKAAKAPKPAEADAPTPKAAASKDAPPTRVGKADESAPSIEDLQQERLANMLDESLSSSERNRHFKEFFEEAASDLPEDFLSKFLVRSGMKKPFAWITKQVWPKRPPRIHWTISAIDILKKYADDAAKLDECYQALLKIRDLHGWKVIHQKDFLEAVGKLNDPLDFLNMIPDVWDKRMMSIADLSELARVVKEFDDAAARREFLEPLADAAKTAKKGDGVKWVVALDDNENFILMQTKGRKGWQDRKKGLAKDFLDQRKQLDPADKDLLNVVDDVQAKLKPQGVVLGDDDVAGILTGKVKLGDLDDLSEDAVAKIEKAVSFEPFEKELRQIDENIRKVLRDKGLDISEADMSAILSGKMKLKNVDGVSDEILDDFSDILTELGYDKGILRRYKNVIELVYDQIENQADKDRFLKKIFAGLGTLGTLDDDAVLTLRALQYKDLRGKVRDAVEDVFGQIKPLNKDNKLLDRMLLDRFLNAAEGPSAKGHIFSAYRRARLAREGKFTNLPDVSSFKTKDIDGGSGTTRTPDGAGTVGPGYRGAPPEGAYYFEDKAGSQAFKIEQAKDYAALHKANQLDPKKGVVYFFDSSQHAQDAFDEMATLFKPSLKDNGIFVASFGPKGNLVWHSD